MHNKSIEMIPERNAPLQKFCNYYLGTANMRLSFIAGIIKFNELINDFVRVAEK
jgi:hypothetical protein